MAEGLVGTPMSRTGRAGLLGCSAARAAGPPACWAAGPQGCGAAGLLGCWPHAPRGRKVRERRFDRVDQGDAWAPLGG